MIRANAHMFGAIRTLVSVGLLAIGVVASTGRPSHRRCFSRKPRAYCPV
jgi:hypothetical protein